MRYAPEHNDATRERILEAASRLFREHGIAAVGLAKIMADAGLTVGTFYTHFKSKEVLLREALLRSLDARHEELERALHEADLEMVVRAYLSPEHRDSSGTGCPIAALASEVARHPRATRHTFASHNAPTLDVLAAWSSSSPCCRRFAHVTRLVGVAASSALLFASSSPSLTRRSRRPLRRQRRSTSWNRAPPMARSPPAPRRRAE